MARKKLLADIKANPARFYRMPADVMRDRRFDDGERMEILRAWTTDADEIVTQQLHEAVVELENRMADPVPDHAAE